MTAEEFVINEEKLAHAADYNLSMKQTHKESEKRYLYITYRDGKCRCVKEDEKESLIAAVEEKKRLKEERRRFRAELKAMSRPERKDFRQQVKLYKIIRSIKLDPQQDQMANGDTRDSKDEVIASQVLERLGIEYKHTPHIRANGWTYQPDFVVNGVLWEHMGVCDNPNYEARNKRKLEDYDADNYRYIVTRDHPSQREKGKGYIKVPEILWALVKGGLVKAGKVLRTYFPKWEMAVKI